MAFFKYTVTTLTLDKKGCLLIFLPHCSSSQFVEAHPTFSIHHDKLFGDMVRVLDSSSRVTSLSKYMKQNAVAQFACQYRTFDLYSFPHIEVDRRRSLFFHARGFWRVRKSD